MQRLSDSAAWVRFASELMAHTELDYPDICESADTMLKEYKKRFPESSEKEETEGPIIDKIAGSSKLRART